MSEKILEIIKETILEIDLKKTIEIKNTKLLSIAKQLIDDPKSDFEKKLTRIVAELLSEFSGLQLRLLQQKKPLTILNSQDGKSLKFYGHVLSRLLSIIRKQKIILIDIPTKELQAIFSYPQIVYFVQICAKFGSWDLLALMLNLNKNQFFHPDNQLNCKENREKLVNAFNRMVGFADIQTISPKIMEIILWEYRADPMCYDAYKLPSIKDAIQNKKWDNVAYLLFDLSCYFDKETFYTLIKYQAPLKMLKLCITDLVRIDWNKALIIAKKYSKDPEIIQWIDGFTCSYTISFPEKEKILKHFRRKDLEKSMGPANAKENADANVNVKKIQNDKSKAKTVLSQTPKVTPTTPPIRKYGTFAAPAMIMTRTAPASESFQKPLTFSSKGQSAAMATTVYHRFLRQGLMQSSSKIGNIIRFFRRG